MDGKDNIRILLPILVFALLMLLPGCKTTKIIAPVVVEPDANVLLLEKIAQATPDIRIADSKKFSVSVQLNGSTYNSPAILKIVADSLIQLTVMPVFGAEMFSAYISPAEIIVVDKLKSNFYQFDYQFIENRLNLKIDYKTIESLLLNRLFVAGSKLIAPGDFRQQKSTDTGLIMIAEKSNSIQENYIRDDFRPRKISIRTKNLSHEFTADYGDFSMQENILFPLTIILGAKSGKQVLSVKISLNRVIFNQPVSITIPDLSVYKRGNIENILK